MAEPDFRLWQRLEPVPPLGVLAALAALVDLGGTRITLRLLGDGVAPDTLLILARAGDLPRNLVAVAGMVALLGAVVPLITAQGAAAVARSIGLAGFTGFFLLMLAVATVTSGSFSSKGSVTLSLFATMLAAHFLSAIVAGSAALRSSPRGLRVALVLLALASLLGIFTVSVSLMSWLMRSSMIVLIAKSFQYATEAAYTLVPFAAGITLVRPLLAARAWWRLSVGLLGVSAAAMLFAVGLAHEEAFRDVLYAAFGWRQVLEDAPIAYAVPVAAYGAVGAIGITSGDGPEQQLGAGVLLLAASGMVPSTPARLLMWALGVVLLSRAAIVLGERLIAQRS